MGAKHCLEEWRKILRAKKDDKVRYDCQHPGGTRDKEEEMYIGNIIDTLLFIQ